MPLLVNLLFGLLGLGFLMCLHAGSAQELLSADGTRRKKNVKGRELNSFAILDFSVFLFFSEKPPSIYLAF